MTLHVAIIIPAQSTDEVAHVDNIRTAQTYDDITIHPVVDDTVGLSAARNRGAAVAEADIYAFTDADASPCNKWVEELVTGFETGELAVGGPAYPNLREGLQLPQQWHWLVGCGPYYGEITEVRNTYGCNFAIRADIFDELGGFNESLGKGTSTPHGEEMELARRMASRYGVQMQFRPNAKVYHEVSAAQRRYSNLAVRAYRQGVTKGRIGYDETESGFIKNELLTFSPFELGLVGAGAAGYVRGKVL